ncbi:MAG: glycosyltransferase, partial [Bacteroidales bacterium]|nr:glycosyltransferase [Bacteroidales bacterium]
MLTFDFNLSLPVIILLACAAACALLVWSIYLRRISRVSRYAASQSGPEAYLPDTEHTADVTEPAGEGFLISNDDDEDDVSTDIATNDIPTGTEPASIVVYAQDEAESLTRLLHQLLGQRYAPGFEVIVVNEGGSEATADAVTALAVSHSNLYLTYTPDGARNLSRKKLALMLGIKAARHRVVVQTVATACIESPYWLASIMRHFADTSTEVVLGNAMPAATDNGLGSRRRAFDFAASATSWLTSAIAGHPYRGTEYNIAYTRDIFFRNKGFSRSLNLRYGDDDIFISEIANGANTAVELSPDGLVRMAFHN